MRYEMDVNRDLSLAHPRFGCQLWRFVEACELAHSSGQTAHHWRVFELYRHPDRQDYLLRQGTTQCGAWNSAHQYGLAADFAAQTAQGTWYWPEKTAYEELHALAHTHDIAFPVSWDPGHCESRFWPTLKSFLLTMK